MVDDDVILGKGPNVLTILSCNSYTLLDNLLIYKKDKY